MKPYETKRAEIKLNEVKQAVAVAKLAEGQGMRKEAIEAFKRPP